jgi:hypothetical protein
MRVCPKIPVLAAAMLLPGSPAVAQATNDVQCLLASNLFSMAAKEEKTRKLAESNKFYFLGRVSARLSEQQIRAQMIAEGKMIKAANAAKIMDACNRQMRAAAMKVEAVGKQVAPRKK